MVPRSQNQVCKYDKSNMCLSSLVSRLLQHFKLTMIKCTHNCKDGFCFHNVFNKSKPGKLLAICRSTKSLSEKRRLSYVTSNNLSCKQSSFMCSVTHNNYSLIHSTSKNFSITTCLEGVGCIVLRTIQIEK